MVPIMLTSSRRDAFVTLVLSEQTAAQFSSPIERIVWTQNESTRGVFLESILHVEAYLSPIPGCGAHSSLRDHQGSM